MIRQKITAALLAIFFFAWAPIANATQTTLTTPGPSLTMAQLATFLNNAFSTVATNYSGPTAPAVCAASTACQYQYWLDTSTTPKTLRINDGVSWVAIGTLDTTGHTFTIPTSFSTATQVGSSYTAQDSDKGTLVRFTNAGAVALTQPQAGAGGVFTAGWFVDYRAANTGTVTITPTISTIDGSSSPIVLPPGRSIRLVSDGTNYFTDNTIGTPTTAVLGGVFSKAAVTSNWLRSLGTDGNFTASQPTCGDLSNSQPSCSTDTTNASNISSGTLPGGRMPALTGDVTMNVGTTVTVVGNLPTGTTVAGSLLATAIVAPGTPAAGKASIYVDSTTKALTNKDDAGILHTTIVADTGASNNFLTAISAAGVISKAQPAFSNLSGSATCAQLPALAGGDVTSSAGSCVTALVNIPTGTPAVGTILHSNIAAPASPAAGKVSVYSDSTDLRFHDKNASGVIGTTVVADTGAANNFLTAISAAGAISKAQPAFSNLSGSATCAQLPALTGDVTTSAGTCATTVVNLPTGTTMAGSVLATAIVAPGTPAAGKASIYVDSTSKNFAIKNDAGTINHGIQTRTATANNWIRAIADDGTTAISQPAFTDISGVASAAQLPNPTASTLGGVQSLAAVSHFWINTISTSGVPSATQPAFTDISGTALIAQGGTSQTTALAARGSSGLNVDDCTSTGDANYTIVSTNRCVYHTALSAARTDTLPAANSLNPGQRIYIVDFRGVVSASNTITLLRAGADTINGSTSVVAINAQFGYAVYMSDGVSRWTFQAGGGGGGGGVSSITAGNGLDGGVITTSGTVSAGYRRQFMLPL